MNKKQKSLADLLFPIEKVTEETAIIDIPPEQRRLHTETYDFSIDTLVGYLDNENIYIPKFQRKYVWNRSQASRLIESLIIQCPIPVIYLNQEKDERLSVIDGNQRLTSVKLFLKDDFELQGLTAYPELEGNKFSDLDIRIQRHIKNRTLRCITIMKETHPQIKFDVFERINTGAVQLNPQEVRHGIYHGELLKAIDTLSEDKTWKTITGYKDDSRMKGSELILRFIALSQDLDNYKKPLKKFLNEYLSNNQNPSAKSILAIKNTFNNSLLMASEIFEKKAFRLLNRDLSLSSNNINVALFDAVMVGISKSGITEKNLINFNRDDFLRKYVTLITNPDFSESITSGTSATNLVMRRIDMFTDFLKQYFRV